MQHQFLEAQSKRDSSDSYEPNDYFFEVLNDLEKDAETQDQDDRRQLEAVFEQRSLNL